MLMPQAGESGGCEFALGLPLKIENEQKTAVAMLGRKADVRNFLAVQYVGKMMDAVSKDQVGPNMVAGQLGSHPEATEEPLKTFQQESHTSDLIVGTSCSGQCGSQGCSFEVSILPEVEKAWLPVLLHPTAAEDSMESDCKPAKQGMGSGQPRDSKMHSEDPMHGIATTQQQREGWL
ncbi:hypothetical protein P7K49_014219 [Saguinus oedipus]|uniref:Uncharacterized protein n=1 Tax=Saguinus oedipus TaxID=9490 RepID=A0ABQ9VI73_SAGOE|nr:hypothetical protein P7K49_014219 [Saguinus oedipus]